MLHSTSGQPLFVELAQTAADVFESQKLRYQVFALEQGARLESEAEQIDRDEYDHYCHHLLVREKRTNRLVGSTRILTTENACNAGSFYSENEFDLHTMFANLNGRAIEVGRTCIHHDYRNGSGISMLWSGLAQFIVLHKINFVFGCASVSTRDGGAQAAAIAKAAAVNYWAPESYRVNPRLRMLDNKPAEKLQFPPLLKTYLKLGAWVAGEPCIDPDFNVADFFVLLDRANLNTRYHHHFIAAATRSQPELAC